MEDRTEDYKEVIERQNEYLAEQQESRMFSEIESRTIEDFTRAY
jgi:hypothetical protein